MDKSITKETWFNQDLVVYQPRSGYRYTVDPLILCALARPVIQNHPIHILDIGCGCGIMPLILGYRHPQACITGVEIQKDLTTIATRNTQTNGFEHRIRILHRDITRLSVEDIKTPADLILSNPPYKKKGTGRINPSKGRALARHEITLTIDQLFASAGPLLSPTGRICLIFPADRLADLEAAALASGFYTESICPVLTKTNQPPFRIVVSAVKNPKTSRALLPPFILYGDDGSPTKAYKTLFNP